MISLLGKALGTGSYYFYTHQYQLCNIDFPVILTQNFCGKIILIPERESMHKYAFIYIYGVYKWHFYMYVSVHAIGSKQVSLLLGEYLCWCDVHLCGNHVDTDIFVSMNVYCYITTSSL